MLVCGSSGLSKKRTQLRLTRDARIPTFEETHESVEKMQCCLNEALANDSGQS